MNITLSADADVIAAARERARSEDTTVNEQFRIWLAQYAHADRVQRYEHAMAGLRGKVVLGRRIGRDEMNER